MNTILSKQRLSAEVFRMEIEAKEIAEARKPGQFIILQMGGDFGERIPLTIADADPVKGSITLIFQAVGETTHRLALLEVGDTIENLLGPLGKTHRHQEIRQGCLCRRRNRGGTPVSHRTGDEESRQ